MTHRGLRSAKRCRTNQLTTPTLDPHPKRCLDRLMTKRKLHRRKLGALIIAGSSYFSYSVYNDLQRGWVWVEGGVKASPEQDPIFYYLHVGFYLLTCPIFFVVGLVYLFSNKDLKKGFNGKKGANKRLTFVSLSLRLNSILI